MFGKVVVVVGVGGSSKKFIWLVVKKENICVSFNIFEVLNVCFMIE